MTFYLYQPSTKKRLNPAAPLVAGQTLYLDELPTLNGKPDWSIELDAGALEGKIRFGYSLNNAPDQAEWSPPYVLGNRQALNLKPGSYNLSYIATADGTGNRENFNFVVMATKPAPVVVPATEIAGGGSGTNFDGATDPTGDPVAHPELLTLKTINCTWQRNWDVDGTSWTVNKNWKAAGFKNALQIQMPNKQMFADYGISMVSRVIASKAVDAVMLGNEFNTYHLDASGKWDANNPGNYFGGTEQQATTYCQVAGERFIAAGVIPVAPSRINDLPGIESRVKSGAYGPIKNVDLHLYSNDENWLAGQIQQFDQFCAANGLQGWVSEWNLRMLKGETLAQWGVRLAVVLKAFAQTGLIAIHFSGIPTGHPQDDVTATFDAKYQPFSLPIFAAVVNP